MRRTDPLTQLRNALADLYPEWADITRIADQIGLPRDQIRSQQTARNNWHAILMEADRRNRVTVLIEAVRDEFVTGENMAFDTAAQTYLDLPHPVRGRPSELNRAEQQSHGTSITADSLLDPSRTGPDPRRVFVVHGRNLKARDAMFAFLRALDLSPIEWEDAVNLSGIASPFVGQVLTSALESAQAVVVLLTGDDEARVREQFREEGEAEEQLTPQPRANVLFEAGLAFGHYPDRTILVELGSLRRFSDVTGQHTVRIAKADAVERERLRMRLERSGCVLGGGTDWLTVGDFRGALRATGKLSLRRTTREAPSEQGLGQGQRIDSDETGPASHPATTTRPPQSTASSRPHRTWVVDALGRGDYPTISAAIEAAQPSDHIRVRSGVYEEGIVLDKALEIVGDGPRDEVIVQARDTDAVRFAAATGRVANLTIRYLGSGEGGGVSIEQGRLVLEGCDVFSESEPGVAIYSGADALVRRNTIRSSESNAVFIYDQGRGTLEDNEIVNESESNAAVAIETEAAPVLRRNAIRSTEMSGVRIKDQGRGTLEDNEIVNESESNAAVAIETEAAPVLRRNAIRSTEMSGVRIKDQGRGTLEDNEIVIESESRAAVSISESAAPVLRRNTIRNSKGSGVYIHNQGRGTLEENEIVDNAVYGIIIESGGEPVVRRNRINRNGNAGIRIRGSGGGTIVDNELTGNSEGPWKISSNASELTRLGNRE